MAATVCARETSRIELGTAVVPTYPRHPIAMAQAALSAAAFSGNRFTLGIGLSHQIVIEGMLGFSFAKPYSHMREYLAVLAPLIRTGQVSFAGDEFRVNATLNVPGAKPCPILVAALAPKMLALAGRETDGTITWMTGPKTIREHTVRVSAGGRSQPTDAARRGRTADRRHDEADAARASAARTFRSTACCRPIVPCSIAKGRRSCRRGRRRGRGTVRGAISSDGCGGDRPAGHLFVEGDRALPGRGLAFRAT
jgi:alkanesulfonate monooxygenase SsuD/methylene tetrahydromethanopterin reductase-like flavin-dependent oxidoreductase (luciferase family)